MSPDSGSPPDTPPVPAVLRLIQHAVLGRWRATGEELYRELSELADARSGREILVSGCGEGATTEWLATRTGASVTGVDASRGQVERADARLREMGHALPLQYEHAPLDDLPHESDVFDAAIGEPALSAAADPARAVAELVRVTRPMGEIILLQLTWSSDIPTEARGPVVERLGLRPHMLVEWKQLLRDAGVVDIQVQDWTAGAAGSGNGGGTGADATPRPPQLGWREKVQIVGHTLRRSGWHAARGAVAREAELVRDISRERALGFALLKGVKWPHPREE